MVAKMYDITVIVTAHAEGRLLHRTLRSVEVATEYARSQDIRCEVIVVADNADNVTADYLEVHFHSRNDAARKFHVSFADPGLARNYGAEKAVGKYVAFLDGDDLISRTWLCNAFLMAEKRGTNIVCCPEYLITFENQNMIIKYKATSDVDFCMLNLFEYNSWCSIFFVDRKLFLANKFRATPLESGFGYEDWHWYLQVIANKIDIVIAPETVAFYRRKAAGSRLQVHGQNSVLCPKTVFFDINLLEQYSVKPSLAQNVIPPEKRKRSELGSALAQRFYRITDRIFLTFPNLYPWLRRKGVVAKIHGRKPAFPKWLLDEWKAVNALEPQIFPDKETLNSICWYTPHQTRIAQPYIDLVRLYGDNVSHVFFVPWLKRGGADRVVINYIKALVELGGHEGIVVISDRDDDSPWSCLLPDNVKFIEFGKLFAHLSLNEREQLIARLIVQYEPRVIHNINSELFYEVLLKYGKAISNISKLYTSVFCLERTLEGKVVGYPFKYLDRVIDYQDKVLFENKYFLEYLLNMYSFEESRLVLMYTPFEHPHAISQIRSLKSDHLDILWAGRFDRQKRPDLLIDIAVRCSDQPFTFHVYGGALLSLDMYTAKLQQLPNVKLYGTFDGLHSLPLSDYDVFLFTSEFEGIPTIVLDAIAARLPVVASAVGGIPEVVIDNETGILIEPYDDINKYVDALVSIYNQAYDLNKIVENACRHINEQHSWDHFKCNLQLLKGYSG